jgi:hypothetical protein
MTLKKPASSAFCHTTDAGTATMLSNGHVRTPAILSDDLSRNTVGDHIVGHIGRDYGAGPNQ